MNPAPSASERLRRTHRAVVAAAPDHDPFEWAADLARAVSRGRPEHMRQQLADNAFEHLENAIHGYDPTRPLRPWALAVLRYRLLDLYQNPVLVPLPDDATSEPAEENPPGERLRTKFEAIRGALEEAHFYPTPEGPDHYAVFALELRLRLGERVGRANEADPTPLTTAAEWLPWSTWLGPRRVNPNWPRLAELWTEAEGRGRIPAASTRGAFVGACVRAVSPYVPWAEPTWRQWVRRGAKSVQQRISDDVWQANFGLLFPQRDETNAG